MLKINPLRTLSFLDIDATSITPEARELLTSYLLVYVDVELQEDLFYVEEWDLTLQAANVPIDAAGTEILAALKQVCEAHGAAYVRFVVE